MSTTHGERLAAGLLDLLGRRVDGARQLGVRLGGLGGDDDVGAVARGAQADGLADAAARAGDEERLALEGRIAMGAHSSAARGLGPGALGGAPPLVPAGCRAARPRRPARTRAPASVRGLRRRRETLDRSAGRRVRRLPGPLHARHIDSSRRDGPRKAHASSGELCAEGRTAPQNGASAGSRGGCGAPSRRRLSPQARQGRPRAIPPYSGSHARACDLECRPASAPRGTSRYRRPTVSSQPSRDVPARLSCHRSRADGRAGRMIGPTIILPAFPSARERSRDGRVSPARGSRAPPARSRRWRGRRPRSRTGARGACRA